MFTKTARCTYKYKSGSALIMTIILTAMLSVVALLFVLAARMDNASTSNITESKTLDFAAESLLTVISKQLVLDTPGIDGQEYRDYPDSNDAWLASIEPTDYNSTGEYYWPQISDITGWLQNKNYEVQNVSINKIGKGDVVKEYPDLDFDSDGELEETSADADGDGIADAKWFEFDDFSSSTGDKVYAAVRIIDNSAMVNLNTAYKFDSDDNQEWEIDGSSQLQVNLAGLLKSTDNINNFVASRSVQSLSIQSGRSDYDKNITWQYNWPLDPEYNRITGSDEYSPYGICDELELRYRFCIDSRTKTRIENEPNSILKTVRGAGDPDFGNVYDTTTSTSGGSTWGLTDWQNRIADDDYRCYSDSDRRHLLTTYNFSNAIAPDGKKKYSISHRQFTAQELYDRLTDPETGCIEDDFLSTNEIEDMHAYIAQFCANLADKCDNIDDTNVTIVEDRYNSNDEYYGYEKPYIYISEITRNFAHSNDVNDVNLYRSYAIELYKEYDTYRFENDTGPWYIGFSYTDVNANDLEKDIFIDANSFLNSGGNYYVKAYINDNNMAPLSIEYTDSPVNGANNVSPNVILSWDKYFFGYDANSNPIFSDKYDVYFSGVSKDAVDSNDSAALASEKQTGLHFWPAQHLGQELPKNRTYYWKVIAFTSDPNIDPNDNQYASDTYSFTTWEEEPNNIEFIDVNEFLLDEDTKISLWRLVDRGGYLLVDEVNLPNWFIDDSNEGIRSYQRALNRQARLKRIWSTHSGSDLGHYNSYTNDTTSPVQAWNYETDNVGDIVMMLKYSTYLEGAAKYRIGPNTTEFDARFDINSPSMQNIFNYITKFDPVDIDDYYDVNEMRIAGQININTAPAFVIKQLPWLQRVNRKDMNIADAIIAYRDKLNISSDGGANYDPCRYDELRYTEQENQEIYENKGFNSIGQLLNVTAKTGIDDEYDIRYLGNNNSDQYGYPDLTFSSWSRHDGVKNDIEEKAMLFSRISDLVTVRSDVFTAYMVLRLGKEGPQKRFIAILDRTGVRNKSDDVSVVAFQSVPPPR